ncbi:MAG: HNH endonuclease signature motif containing protein [bacterium]|nr:HNH endonuclease signature motif containing protein [bacterium]
MHKSGDVIRQLVDIGETPNSCWHWLGSVSKTTGYGKKQLNGKTLLAHRWVYEMLLGPIPGGLVIDHKCKTRHCVNPHHLEVVDQAENCRRSVTTKLTAEQVIEIKAAKDGKKWGEGARLARKYGVSSALIHDIWNGRAWK